MLRSIEVSPDRAAAMYRIYVAGATLQEVGDRFGISRERVRQVFREAGLSTRSPAEAGAMRRARQIREMNDEIYAAFSESKDLDDVIYRVNAPRSVITAVIDTHFSKAARSRRKTVPQKYSDRELIDCLKQASASLGGVITTADYTGFARERRFDDGRPWPTHQTHFKRFGSWRHALEAAGLRSNPSSAISGQVLFTQAHCVDALRAAKRELGKLPTAAEYEHLARASGGALPSLATVRNRCGTWSEALSMAGL